MFLYLSIAVFLVVAITVHELGHAFAMRRKGIEIKLISIGIPLPRMPKIRLKRVFPGTDLMFSPLLIGALVQPTEKGNQRLKEMSYKEGALILGGGILANVFFALFMFALAMTLVISKNTSLVTVGELYCAVICTALALWKWREAFCFYILPVAGFIILGLLIYDICCNQAVVAGPIGIARLAAENKEIAPLIFFLALVSLGIGKINSIPFFPLDGGLIFCSILVDCKYCSLDKKVRIVGVGAFVALLGFAIINDILALFK